MTAEKCIQFAASGNWRYAGLEFGTQCVVGNTLRTTSPEPQSDCGKPCGGNAGELCGSGNRMQLYVDGSWFLPSVDQVVASLKQYNSTLDDVWTAINLFQGVLQKFQADLGVACALSRKRAGSCELTPLLRSDSASVQSSFNALSRVQSRLGRLCPAPAQHAAPPSANQASWIDVNHVFRRHDISSCFLFFPLFLFVFFSVILFTFAMTTIITICLFGLDFILFSFCVFPLPPFLPNSSDPFDRQLQLRTLAHLRPGRLPRHIVRTFGTSETGSALALRGDAARTPSGEDGKDGALV
ncbi:hypothetical protein VTK73DRAFT_6171 [Phialemonium thermophilum]|uniref:WSC domain-containing protein n=1 Tax=Phialemonium thermophilum TaxID=223376 RepID=A0ABR3V0J1_9PEZI